MDMFICEQAPDWVGGREGGYSRGILIGIREELAEGGLRRAERAESGLGRSKWRREPVHRLFMFVAFSRINLFFLILNLLVT